VGDNIAAVIINAVCSKTTENVWRHVGHADVHSLGAAGDTMVASDGLDRMASLMTQPNRHDVVDRWWRSLTAAQHAEVAALDGVIPAWMVISLLQADVMVAGTKQDADPMFSFRLPVDVKKFVKAQRETGTGRRPQPSDRHAARRTGP